MRTRSVSRTAAVAVTATVLALLAGCGGGGDTGSGAPPRTLTVFAAASLTGTFTELEKRFERANPGTDVTFNFAGSSALAQQIVQGAPTDVFASADETNMRKVTGPGLTAGEPAVFATNTLQIATAPGNPMRIASLRDLTRPGLRTVLCAPQVPCGAAAEKVERAAGVSLRPVSEEQDVKAVLNKVGTGNADAGLVYRTDVAAARGQVQGVDIAQAGEAVNRYPIAALTGSRDPELAGQWVRFVTGEQGGQVLTAAGFGTP